MTKLTTEEILKFVDKYITEEGVADEDLKQDIYLEVFEVAKSKAGVLTKGMIVDIVNDFKTVSEAAAELKEFPLPTYEEQEAILRDVAGEEVNFPTSKHRCNLVESLAISGLISDILNNLY